VRLCRRARPSRCSGRSRPCSITSRAPWSSATACCPSRSPAGGLIVLRDGDPGEPEQALGGFGSTYYQHAVEIEVYVEDGDAAGRDTAFDDLLQQIGTALDADPTLGGLAFGLTNGRPEASIEAISGAPAIKSGTLIATVDYETTAPLA
jgi:hypothetical protein